MPTPVHAAIQTFVDLALKARQQNIEDAYEDELADAAAKLASKGMSRSSSAWEATELRLKAEKLQKLITAQAETLIEAFQAHDARIDEPEILRQVGSFSSQSAGGIVAGYQGNATQVAARTGRMTQPYPPRSHPSSGNWNGRGIQQRLKYVSSSRRLRWQRERNQWPLIRSTTNTTFTGQTLA